jgi:lipopolysaccharide/colanic/teichoic acid biosynthesis glycosyltransferase
MYKLLKRLIDIAGGLIGTLLLVILTPIIGLAIVTDSRGPIFVKLDRVSSGQRITIIKFRSMVKDAQRLKAGLIERNERKDGPFFKIKNDPRVTRVGKVIRKYRLDEFPQFLSVLSGALSLVGPRPHEPGEIAHYPTEFHSVFHAKAGITGLSQVSGASSLTFAKELELDSWYLKNQSIWLDLKIIGKTVAIIFTDPSAV